MFRKPIVILLQELPRNTEKTDTSNVNGPLAQALFHRLNNIPDQLSNSSKVGKINRFRGLCGPSRNVRGQIAGILPAGGVRQIVSQ
jgi:hypothetical protein